MRHNPNFVAREVGGELVLVPVTHDAADLNSVYALNEVAAHIWKLIESEATEHNIARALCEVYDVSAEDALRDVREFLAQLGEIGAVVDD